MKLFLAGFSLFFLITFSIHATPRYYDSDLGVQEVEETSVLECVPSTQINRLTSYFENSIERELRTRFQKVRVKIRFPERNFVHFEKLEDKSIEDQHPGIAFSKINFSSPRAEPSKILPCRIAFPAFISVRSKLHRGSLVRASFRQPIFVGGRLAKKQTKQILVSTASYKKADAHYN